MTTTAQMVPDGFGGYYLVMPRLTMETPVRLIEEFQGRVSSHASRVGRIILLACLGNQSFTTIETHLDAAIKKLAEKRGTTIYVKRAVE